MTQLIQAQIMQVFMMLNCGISVTLLFQVCNEIKQRSKALPLVGSVFYLFAFAAAAYVISSYLYSCNYGVINVQEAIAFALGALLWKKIIYGIIYKGEIYGKEKEKKENK